MGNLKDKSLYVAMACYRSMEIPTVQSLLRLSTEAVNRKNFKMAIDFHVGEAPIGRARNDLTHNFLKSDFTHILFVDSDLIFDYEQIERILDHDEDIVGGILPDKAARQTAHVLQSADFSRSSK